MASEKRLIDANDLLNAIRDDYNINGAHFSRIRRHIEDAPAVDAVEVVRCKDCKWATAGIVTITPNKLICTKPINWHSVEPGYFCCFGERKDG